jgi:hypothetical protein
MLKINSLRQVLLITSIAALAACSTVMPNAPTGFLSSYTELSAAPDKASASLSSRLQIDPARISIEPVEWRVKAGVDVSSDEKAALLAQMQAALQSQVAALPAAPNGRAVRLRAAITQVETVSPALNTVSTLLLFAPLDRGGAALEIEAVDASNGKQLAALTIGYFAPMSEVKARFSKLAPAQLAVQKAVDDFALLLRPLTLAAGN